MDSTNEKVLKQAIEAHKAGKLQDAESLYRAILLSHPKHPDANHNLGVLVVFENKLASGLQLFETALEADPSRGQFWVSYIDALIKAKQFSNARNALSQGKRVGLARERVEEIYSKFLLQHYQSGEYELAENLAKDIILKYPGHHFSWKVLGAICQHLGRLQESLYANQRALEISPHDHESHSNLGTTLRDLGKLVDAESSYVKAIALKPDFAPAHNNLGTTLRDLGKLVEAEASYAKAIALKPDYAQAHSNLGTTLRDLGKLVEAEASYSKAIALNPNVAEFHNNLRYLQESIAKIAKLSINTVKNFDKSIEASNFKGWHKDDSIQYWPTKKITNNFDEACRELFKSQAPKFPIFSQNASIGTMGSCFAMRIREWMKYQNKKSDTIFIPATSPQFQ
jgi:tetratricopeptide (TPR) repeat protein